MEATAQTIRLDSNIVSILHSRAEHQQQSVEDYTNHLLRVILDVQLINPSMSQGTQRTKSIERLCGILKDDGLPFDQTRQEIMEERYGTV